MTNVTITNPENGNTTTFAVENIETAQEIADTIGADFVVAASVTLSGPTTTTTTAKRPGRPKGSKNKTVETLLANVASGNGNPHNGTTTTA